MCTNTVFKLWASSGRAQNSLTRFHSSITPTGTDLPSPRFISNALCQQSSNVFNNRGLNELVTFFGQFIDHTFIATPPGSDSMPIPIATDDPIFANFTGGQLQFFRSLRAKVDIQGSLRGSGRRGNSGIGRDRLPRPGTSVERPINAHTAVLDLASVYGSDDMRAEGLRSFSGGMLKTSPGDRLPLNSGGLSNVPLPNNEYFVAGDIRSNEHPVLTSLHVIFLREHNDLCVELASKFPDWDDERLYQNARKINGAQFQKITLEEYYPAMVGKQLPSQSRLRLSVRPDIFDVFSTAAFRVGHTMVGNQITRRGPGNSELPSLSMVNMFFREASKFEGADEFIRGATQTRAQEIDLQVHNALRNFLFTNVPVVSFGFDLIAFNLQRGRDHALPSFTEIQSLLGIRQARSFADISRNANVQSGLQSVYGSVDRVEAWVGLVAEDYESGSSMGRTLNAIWEMQFSVLRDGDRLYYRNRNVFSQKLRDTIPRVEGLFSESDIFRSLILRNTDVSPSELPARIFF